MTECDKSLALAESRLEEFLSNMGASVHKVVGGETICVMYQSISELFSKHSY